MSAYTCFCGSQRVAGKEHFCGDGAVGARTSIPGFGKVPIWSGDHHHQVVEVELDGTTEIVARYCSVMSCDWEDRLSGWGPPLWSDREISPPAVTTEEQFDLEESEPLPALAMTHSALVVLIVVLAVVVIAVRIFGGP